MLKRTINDLLITYKMFVSLCCSCVLSGLFYQLYLVGCLTPAFDALLTVSDSWINNI